MSDVESSGLVYMKPKGQQRSFENIQFCVNIHEAIYEDYNCYQFGQNLTTQNI